MSQTALPHDSDDLDKPIWGAKAIAKVANVDTRKAFHLLKIGVLDASKAGALHVSTPRRILRSLGIQV